MSRYRVAKQNCIADKDRSRSLLLAGTAVCVLFFVLMTVTISCKAHYFNDEFNSYLIANNVVGKTDVKSPRYEYLKFLRPEEGKQLSPAKKQFNRMLAPTFDNQLQYRQVLKNLTDDTAPPMYFLLLNTLCSFVPGTFSKWFAGVLNIIFALLVLALVRKLCRLFTDDEAAVLAVTCVFAFSATILNCVAYLRMYIMAMFWVTSFTYILVRNAKRDLNARFYAAVFAVAFFGVLTHYYCALYFIPSGVVFGLFLLYDRKYGQLCGFCAASLAAAICAYLFFPAMAHHILHGVRGTEAIANALGLAETADRLKFAFSMVNKPFGGLLAPVVAAVLFSAAACRKKDGGAQNIRSYCLTFVPVVAYILAVAKIMPFTEYDKSYIQIRYFTPVFAVLLSSLLLCLFAALARCAARKTYLHAVAAISAAVVLGNLAVTDFGDANLYRAYANDPQREICEAVDAVYIGNVDNVPYMYELSGCKSVTRFASPEKAKKSPLFRSLAEGSRLVIATASSGQLTPAQSDAMIKEALGGAAAGKNIMRKPYFYDKDHAVEDREGYIYYVVKMKNEE